ncbi:MAG: ATP-binding cassette domain-containing protein [Hespellia sp.]|nr:ATP-binding cassette domain-containing protein [Hespellia sp.]
MNTIIRTKGLCKSYHKKTVVKDLDLTVEQGSIYGFLGPNGAGKSTTMKMLLGLAKPTAGAIQIFGKTMNEKNRISILANTGSLIESPSYYGHLTGEENLKLLASIKQVPEAQVEDVLSIVHLNGAKDKKAAHYSFGMKQRLGLAGALLGNPNLLLLDEPTNGLDPAGIQEMRSLICTLPERFGMTVLVSSHLLSEIDQMATHVGILDQGELLFQDSLSALHESSRPNLRIHTTNDKKASRIFKQMGFATSYENQSLVLDSLSDASLYEVGKQLYAQEVGILRIVEDEASLEDIFLKLTGRSLS